MKMTAMTIWVNRMASWRDGQFTLKQTDERLLIPIECRAGVHIRRVGCFGCAIGVECSGHLVELVRQYPVAVGHTCSTRQFPLGYLETRTRRRDEHVPERVAVLELEDVGHVGLCAEHGRHILAPVLWDGERAERRVIAQPGR